MASGDILRIGGSGPVTLKTKPSGIDGTATAGKVVQLLNNNKVKDLPAKRFTRLLGNAGNNLHTVAVEYRGNAHERILPTTDPNVFVCFYNNGSSGSVHYFYAFLFKIDADGNVIQTGSAYNLVSNTHYTPLFDHLERLGNTNKYIFTYVPSGTPTHPRIRGLTVDPVNLTINATAEQNVLSSTTGVTAHFHSLIPLDDSRFLVSWGEGQTDPGSVKAKVGSFDGSAFTWGAEYTVVSNTVIEEVKLIKLDTNKAILMYDYKRARVVDVSTTNLTFGAETTISATDFTPSFFTNDTFSAIETISTTKAIFIWGKYKNGLAELIAITFSVSGSTLTTTTTVLDTPRNSDPDLSTSTNITSETAPRYLLLRKLETNKYLLFYETYGVSNNSIDIYANKYCIFDTVGTSPSIKTVDFIHRFDNGQTNIDPPNITFNQLDIAHIEVLPDKTVIAFDSGSAPRMRVYKLDTDDKLYFQASESCMFDAGITGYEHFKFAKIININQLFVVFDATVDGGREHRYQVYKDFTNGKRFGIYQNDGSVIVQGISYSHKNLAVGTHYYSDDLGNVVNYAEGNDQVYLGRAISDTEILIEKPLIADTGNTYNF